jgi:hypothetical protein
VVALTERSRSALYQGLTDVIQDEVAVGELLSYFPARDGEEPATKEFVAAQIAGLRTDVIGGDASIRADLGGEIAGLRTELRVGLAELESRLTAQMAAMQRTMIQWTLGSMVSLVALVLAMGFLRGP